MSVIPVTENEMREFFNRLTSTIVEGTRTHSELEALKTRFDETDKRVQSLVAELSNVRQELYRTVAERDQARKEAQENKELVEIFQNDLTNLRKERDVLEESHKAIGKQLAETGEKLLRSEDAERYWKTTAGHTDNDRQFWRDRAFKAEGERDKLQEALDKLQEKFHSLGDFVKNMFQEGPKQLEHDPLAVSGQSSLQDQPGESSTKEDPSKSSQEPSPGGVNQRIDNKDEIPF